MQLQCEGMQLQFEAMNLKLGAISTSPLPITEELHVSPPPLPPITSPPLPAPLQALLLLQLFPSSQTPALLTSAPSALISTPAASAVPPFPLNPFQGSNYSPGSLSARCDGARTTEVEAKPHQSSAARQRVATGDPAGPPKLQFEGSDCNLGGGDGTARQGVQFGEGMEIFGDGMAMIWGWDCNDLGMGLQ